MNKVTRWTESSQVAVYSPTGSGGSHVDRVSSKVSVGYPLGGVKVVKKATGKKPVKAPVPAKKGVKKGVKKAKG
jgi:hypothetical protein